MQGDEQDLIPTVLTSAWETGCSGTSSGCVCFCGIFFFHISVLMCVFVNSKAFTQMHYIWTAAGKFKSRSRSGFYTAIVFRGKVSQIAWCSFPNVFPTERQTKAEPSADLKWNRVFVSRPQKLKICKYTFFLHEILQNIFTASVWV